MKLAAALVGILPLAMIGGTPGGVPSPCVIVLVPAVSCDCLMQENVSVTLASGTCQIPGTNPAVFHDCYAKTEAPANPPPAQPNGYCHIDDLCPNTAQPCSFRGFNITITQRVCVTDCCAGGGGVVRLDGVKQNNISPGVAVGPIKCDPGALQCNQHTSKVVTVTCNSTGVIVFRVQASFDCNNCTAAGSDG